MASLRLLVNCRSRAPPSIPLRIRVPFFAIVSFRKGKPRKIKRVSRCYWGNLEIARYCRCTMLNPRRLVIAFYTGSSAQALAVEIRT